MTIHLSHLRIRVVTDVGSFGVDLPFTDGLNIVRADNSAGKSTCVSSIVWALGLEGMLGPEHAVPLPHAMTTLIEDPSGTERTVIESYVMLELRRFDGSSLTVRRHVKSDSIDRTLVRAWEGALLSDPGSSVEPTDYYVRRPGAAQEERGFHRYLASWSDWTLPQVPRFDGSTVPLYLEAIAPLWIVEQKRGWAGVQAQTPNHLRIREVKQRALEFVLSLGALGRRARIQELERRLEELRLDWREVVAVLEAEVKTIGGVVRDLPHQPTGDWPPSPRPSVVLSRGDQWILLRQAARMDVDLVENLNLQSRSTEVVTEALSNELAQVEDELEKTMAAGIQLRHAMAADRETIEVGNSRLSTIEEDRRRHQDLRLLRRLGSDDESLLDVESCPVCHRLLGDVLLEEGDRERVMSVEETINYLTTQADLTTTIIRATRRSLEAREAQFNALAQRSAELRSRLAALRDSLGGVGPAVAEVEALLTARHRLERYANTEINVETALTKLAEASKIWRTSYANLKELRQAELSHDDHVKLQRLEGEFLSQLADYGFGSFQAASMYLSPDTYLPTHDGYDPAFESSASDVIRIVWAYLLSLLCVSDELSLNHPGVLIFDEPRQQMTHELSFRELLRYAASTAGGQVIFATSEDPDSLASMLNGLRHNTVNFEGKVLRPING